MRQALRQMLKVELSLELRQLLRQLLQLVEELIQGDLTMRSVRTFEQAIAEHQACELDDVAHELVRTSPIERTQTVLTVLEYIVAHTREPSDMLGFLARTLREKRLERALPAARVEEGLAQGMRLVLHRPWSHSGGGKPGTPENLVKLLQAIPQYDEHLDRQLWVLAGGWAVELLTGEHLRDHHDLDALVLTRRPLYLDCDKVHTDDYFGVISTSNRFIRDRCIRTVAWSHGRRTFQVDVLCVEFLFCSKFLQKPRPQDWEDVQLLTRKFIKTFDLLLLEDIAKRNACGLSRSRVRELLAILRSRDPEAVIAQLSRFHS